MIWLLNLIRNSSVLKLLTLGQPSSLPPSLDTVLQDITSIIYGGMAITACADKYYE